MNHPFSVARAAACLLLAAAGLPVHAQQAAQAAADAQAAVPATRYQPALNYRPEAAPETRPDANWVASNQTVAATNSMALTMKSMNGQPAPASADPHAGHAGMHGMDMDMDKKEGEGRMSCCESCCKDKMKKNKETS
jgi:hypothetical protein